MRMMLRKVSLKEYWFLYKLLVRPALKKNWTHQIHLSRNLNSNLQNCPLEMDPYIQRPFGVRELLVRFMVLRDRDSQEAGKSRS